MLWPMLSHTLQTLILINYRESSKSNHHILELEGTQRHRNYVSIMPESLNISTDKKLVAFCSITGHYQLLESFLIKPKFPSYDLFLFV